MIYISLLKVSNMLCSMMKDNQNICNININTMGYPSSQPSEDNDRPESELDYTPFRITRTSFKEDGQEMNILALNKRFGKALYNTSKVLSSASLYPILEIEWFRSTLELDSDTLNAMEQFAYLYVQWVGLWGNAVKGTESDLAKKLTEYEVFVKADEISDTPKILANYAVPKFNVRKYRKWNIMLFYSSSFADLYSAVTEQSQTLQEVSIHLPLLLAMFMIDYSNKNLASWGNSSRLSVERALEEEIAIFSRQNVSTHEGVDKKYTYWIARYVTASDRDMIVSVLTMIKARLHEENSNMGTISFTQYKDARGRDGTITAAVRLSCMDLNWETEMARAEQEKAAGSLDATNGGVV